VTAPVPWALLNVQVEDAGGEVNARAVAVRQLLLAGYTGRDRQAVLAHVRELEALGVAAPPRIPSVYVVDPGSIRVTDAVTASGPRTSGEVEVVLVRSHAELLVGVGSDHTDRAWEATDVDEAKRRCPKPVAPRMWRYEDVADHWDELELRSWTTGAGDRQLYQEGTLAELLAVDGLLAELRGAGFDNIAGTVVFGGTVPTLGGLACGERFEIELGDPVLGRSISWGYAVHVP
jgi:Protein of unknown function (DUF2848)